MCNTDHPATDDNDILMTAMECLQHGCSSWQHGGAEERVHCRSLRRSVVRGHEVTKTRARSGRSIGARGSAIRVMAADARHYIYIYSL